MPSQSSLKKLLSSGLFADFIIQCGEEQISVHKAIICAESSFFVVACTVDMQEKATGTIKLDNDIHVIKSVLAFCYGGSYTDNERSAGISVLKHHAMVYTAADQYDIAPLKKLAVDKFVAVANANSRPWEFSTSTEDQKTKDSEIIGLIRYVFQQTHDKSDPLRMAVLKTMKKNYSRIIDENCLFQLVHEVPDFGAAYASFMMKSLGSLEAVESYLRFA